MRTLSATRFDMNKITEPSGVSVWNRIQILTEEYRALYSLLTFRLGVIDQRLPLAAGALAALLFTSSSLTTCQRLMFLWLVPASCIWLHRVVLLHTRAKEDVLRRIDEIETQVNRLASDELMVFQSQHPNRGRVVGGRSGFGSVLAILVVCLLGIVASFIFMAFEFGSNRVALAAYSLYGIAVTCELIYSTRRLRKYRYQRAPQAGSD